MKRSILLTAAGAILFLLIALPFAPFALDDAFITYRYSENLARGEGIRWNPGEDPVNALVGLDVK